MAEIDTNTTNVHDDECTEMFPIKLMRENVQKTRVDVEIARVHWMRPSTEEGDTYEIQVSKRLRHWQAEKVNYKGSKNHGKRDTDTINNTLGNILHLFKAVD